jgi:outer membrane scaffolding protein for murein synthesis (MipA/OmpV family)
MTLLALAACAGLLHGPARADGGGSGAAAQGTQWGLGIAVMSETKPYRGVENKTRVVPAITFENRWVRLFGPGLELKLGQSGPVKFGLTARYSEDGYKPGDSATLAGMAERKSGVWLGARGQLATDWANLSAEWSADASGNSKGQKFKLTAERRFALGDMGISPRVSALWSDSKTNQYNYGVSTTEARAGRPAYNPGSSVDAEVGLRLDYRIAPQQMLFADLGVRSLGTAVKDSPLVGRSSVPEVRLGYLYRF